jgi:hypothetical protein
VSLVLLWDAEALASLADNGAFPYWILRDVLNSAPAAENLMDLRIGADTNRYGAAGLAQPSCGGGAKAPLQLSNPRGLSVRQCADVWVSLRRLSALAPHFVLGSAQKSRHLCLWSCPRLTGHRAIVIELA